MTAHDLYMAALALLGEDVNRVKGYPDFRFALTNQILAECFDVNNAMRENRGAEPIEKMPTVAADLDVLPYEEGLIRECMPYGLASLFVIDDDKAIAGAFSAQYESLKKKYSQGVYMDISNYY